MRGRIVSCRGDTSGNSRSDWVLGSIILDIWYTGYRGYG